ncbi:hypothetical protein [Shimia sp.]|uniref:hypothetical protein n=1 Tax=Shimia sp. TaxID=1954381 RepID=UPI0032970399
MSNIHFALTDHKGGGMAARFYANGVRVSRERFGAIKRAAFGPGGRMDCFATSGRALPGGKTRRTNHSSATVPSWFESVYGEGA